MPLAGAAVLEHQTIQTMAPSKPHSIRKIRYEAQGTRCNFLRYPNLELRTQFQIFCTPATLLFWAFMKLLQPLVTLMLSTWGLSFAGNSTIKASADKLANFLQRIQTASTIRPELDGAFMRAFDFDKWEVNILVLS